MDINFTQTGWAVMIQYPDQNVDMIGLTLHPGIDTPKDVEDHLRQTVAFPFGTNILVFQQVG